jgi:hypothetical protein
VRFQAVNSGFAASHCRGCQPAESRSTVRKTAQESQGSGRRQSMRLSERLDFKTANIWLCEAKKIQADVGARTRDLLLTMQVLYQLSYVGTTANPTLIVR